MILDGSIRAGERLNESVPALDDEVGRRLAGALTGRQSDVLEALLGAMFRLQGLTASGAKPSSAEHWKFLKAIQSGPADRAAKAMRAHIEGARSRMHRAFARLWKR